MNMITRVTKSMIGGRQQSDHSSRVPEPIDDGVKTKESKNLLVKTKLTIAEIVQVGRPSTVDF